MASSVGVTGENPPPVETSSVDEVLIASSVATSLDTYSSSVSVTEASGVVVNLFSVVMDEATEAEVTGSVEGSVLASLIGTAER